MKIHDATEQAYKNGYEAGVKELADRLKFIMCPCVTLKYDDIDTIVKELMKGDAK